MSEDRLGSARGKENPDATPLFGTNRNRYYGEAAEARSNVADGDAITLGETHVKLLRHTGHHARHVATVLGCMIRHADTAPSNGADRL